MRIAIIGGGLCGLAAAYQLTNTPKYDVHIMEENRFGGLADSFLCGDFLFDFGVHVLHIHRERAALLVRKILDDGLTRREYSAQTYVGGRYHKYPPSRDTLGTLPLRTRLRIHQDYYTSRLLNRVHRRIQSLESSVDASFEQWMTALVGRAFYEVFFKEYSEKWWGIAPEFLSSDLIRYAYGTLFSHQRIIKSYPDRNCMKGLTKAFVDVLSTRGVTLKSGRVTGLAAMDDTRWDLTIVTPDGHVMKESYDAVIATNPITETARMLGISPLNLRYRSIIIVGLGFENESSMDADWIHASSSDYAISRVHAGNRFCEDAAPLGGSTLVAEIPCAFNDRTWNQTDDKIIDRVLFELNELALVRDNQIPVCSKVERARYSHPIYFIGYGSERHAVKIEIESYPAIVTTGRQGEYVYCTMEHAIEMGIDAAQNIVAQLES